MKHNIYFHIHKSDKCYVAECADLPIVTQALTLNELAHNIEESVELHLEDEDLTKLLQ